MTLPSRSDQTRTRYTQRSQQLCAQVARLNGLPSSAHVSPSVLAEYLLQRRPYLSRNTWYQYKCSARQHLEDLALVATSEIKTEAELAIKMLESGPSPDNYPKSKQTSALKLKSFKFADLQAVTDYLDAHINKHKFARCLSAWLKAGRITGLRPCEWEKARIGRIDGNPILLVQNAKTTNGRSIGPTRTLDLKDMDPEEIEKIREMINLTRILTENITFSDLQKKVGEYMYRVTRACLGTRRKYPSLYSTRHQFAADAKATHPKKEVGAMLGHGTDRTAGDHYCRAQSAEGPLSINPSAGDVLKVREVAKEYSPEHRLKPKPF